MAPMHRTRLTYRDRPMRHAQARLRQLRRLAAHIAITGSPMPVTEDCDTSDGYGVHLRLLLHQLT